MKKERPEFTILRYLGRPPSLFNDDAIAAVRTILADNQKFNWDKFTEYAVFHKLSQTLYPNLRKFEEEVTAKHAKVRKEEFDNGKTSISENANVGADLCVCPIPDVIIRKFRGIFLANVARNEFLAQELIKINRLLNANGIEMLNWKGPTLAIQAYGDISLRQFMDLDTFVKQEDLEKAKAVLLENGFAHKIVLDEPKYEFINIEKRYEFEIQSKIFTPNTIIDYDYARMFERKKTQLLDNNEVYIQSLLDNLFFISFHGTKHLWFRLRWLADILGLYSSNKEQILEGLKDFKQKDMCYFTIYLAHKAFGIETDKEICNSLNGKFYKNIKIIYPRMFLSTYKPDAFLNYYHLVYLTRTMVHGKNNSHNLTRELYYCCLHTFVRLFIYSFKLPSCQLWHNGNSFFKKLLKRMS
jgi:hypothetical protein